MSLNKLIIEDEYRSNENSILEDFYIPCFEKSILYRRSVGFFSSTSMALAAKGLTALIRAGGKMQLIASPKLSDEDIEAIVQGIRQRDEIIIESTIKELEQEFNEVVTHRLACLSWLLSQKLLEIKLAIPNNVKNLRAKGIYHEKLGIFVDEDNNFVAFSGSANESSTALIANFECIDVFCSWDLGVEKRALRKWNNFEKLWNNETDNLDVIDFPEATKQSLLNFCPDQQPEYELFFPNEDNSQPKLLSEKKPQKYQVNDQIISTEKDRWRHQIEAKQAFLKKRHGILEMATGTGKTRTAISILQHLVTSQEINTVIVTTIGTDLLDQWVEQLYEVASNLNPQFRVLRHYELYYQKDEYALNPIFSILVISSKSLRNVLRSLTLPIRKRLLVIYDEVHSFGSPQMIEDLTGLSEGISYRLGLSATPEREYDLEGTEFIEEHIGSVIYQFGIEEAIRRGILCEFDYYPIEYEPSSEDKGKIQSLYKSQAAKKKAGNPMSETKFWNALAKVHKISQGIDIKSLRSVILFSSSKAKLETVQRIGRCLRKDPNNPRKKAIVVDLVRNQDENKTELNSDQIRKEWLTCLSKIRCEIN